MANPFLGEIRCFGFNFAPVGWAFCNGQLLAISQNAALFNLVGTLYGGDGVNTFALPNLQGKAPMHWGSGPGGFTTTVAEIQGNATVTLTSNQIPIHNHAIISQVVAPGGAAEHAASPPTGAYIGPSNPDGLYKTTAPTINAPFGPAIGSTGASQPHDNMQPYLALSFCIALQGIFPSRN
jgi:microcystin-dependent protein